MYKGSHDGERSSKTHHPVKVTAGIVLCPCTVKEYIHREY